MSSPRPTAPLVQTVVAAGLADPVRLRRWAAHPSALNDLGIDPATLDIDALSKFAGLAEKVRHNPARALMPLTFRLLTLLGQDIDLFRAYALSARNPGRGSSPLDRVEALATFIDDWAGSELDRTLVRDMTRHEHALTRLGALEPVPAAPRGPDATPELAPRGILLVRELTSDPRQLIHVMRQQVPNLADVERGSWTFVYQRGPGASLRVLEIDPAVGDLLRLVGHGLPITSLARHLGFPSDDPVLRRAVDQLVDTGILTWLR